MNQEKIGKFIADNRKQKKLTQVQLANILNVTDKSVSKWENGRSIPDPSLFILLCDVLEISLNELLAGERISDENLRLKSDEILLDVLTTWISEDSKMNEQREKLDPNKEEIMIQVKNLTKIYKSNSIKITALNNVHFEIKKGNFVGIMGASGSGKTTLLNMISSVDKPTSGDIYIDKINIPYIDEKDTARYRKKHLGFIFQDYNLIETLTVYENIALTLIIKEYSNKNEHDMIMEIAEKLAISDILEMYPYEISGGQRQRCASARAIISNPTIILADEPTGALDSMASKQFLKLLSKTQKEYQITVLMVTHDALSASYCDTILFMKDGTIEKKLDRRNDTRQEFFANILKENISLGGE